MKSSADLSLKWALIRWISVLHVFLVVLKKTISAQCVNKIEYCSSIINSSSMFLKKIVWLSRCLSYCFVALWFILRSDLFKVFPCVILSLYFFNPCSIVITSLGEERANLCAFRTFVRFALVWFRLLPLPLGVWNGLRLVVVALPGRFSYLFLMPEPVKMYNSGDSVVDIRKLVYFG